MRRILLVGFIVLLTAGVGAETSSKKADNPKSAETASGAPTGFQDIRFGSSMASVFQKLVQKHRMNLEPNGQYKGQDGVVMETFDNDIVLYNYPLGGKKFKLSFRFNKNEKFFRYELNGEKKKADVFDTELKSDAAFLGRVFEKKFGPASGKSTPNLFDMKPGFVTAAWQWEKPRHTIFTGYGEAQQQYFVTAVVYDNELSKEEEAGLDKGQEQIIEDAAQGL